MPWYNGDYPPSMKNMPVKVRNKAVEIANALLMEQGLEEGVAIATGTKRAKEWAEKQGIATKKAATTKQKTK